MTMEFFPQEVSMNFFWAGKIWTQSRIGVTKVDNMCLA